MKDNLIRIEIGAHTDCRGSYSYNDRLSDLRAKSVVNYLVKNGINEKRIDSKGFGEYELVNRCTDGIPCSSAEHQANRRIEFKVISFDNEQIQENSEVETIYQIQNTFLFRDQLPADFFMECK
jgi:outer membrane protein OmpA-like peptidoglycan-associated protein